MAKNDGNGAAVSSTIAVVTDLASHSLTAAFVFSAQRAVIECMLKSPNRAFKDSLLPGLMNGRVASAPGLSNAMRALTSSGRLSIH